jgi:hypothetical protein
MPQHRMDTQSIYVVSMYAPEQAGGFFWGPMMPDTDLDALFTAEVESYNGTAHVRLFVLDVPTGPALGFPDNLDAAYRQEISDRLDTSDPVHDWDAACTTGALYAANSTLAVRPEMP